MRDGPLRWFCCIGILCAPLCSCKVGPDYQRPALDVPSAYKSATTQESPRPQIARDWWLLFNDATLTSLEESTIRAIRICRRRPHASLKRAAAKSVKSQFYPVITANPSIVRSRGNVRSNVTTQPVSTSSGRPTSISPTRGNTVTSVSIPFDLSYEIDIWGRVRRSYEAATAQATASAEDYEVVLQTLEADVAQDYFTIRSLDAQAQILAQTVESYRRQVALTQMQFDAGLVGKIDLLQAETQLNSTITQDLEIRRQRADLEHALAILLGRPPAEMALAPQPLSLMPPPIPAGLPADLLRNRPDVAEAEQNLAATSAQIGVAKAQFFPTVSLSGAAGFESLDVQHALDWENRFWSIGPSVSIPLFKGGLLEANLQQAKARYDESLGNYRATVLGAFRDVEDSLTDLHMRADEARAQEQAVQAAREYLRLAEVQYERGLANYLLVIDAQRTLLSNELMAVQILNQRLVSTVLLIKAMGGGWSPP